MRHSQHRWIVNDDPSSTAMEHAMSTSAVTRWQAMVSPGRWRMLVAVLTAIAIAAIIVLAAVLVGVSQTPRDGRVPHPEPAPAPIQPR
jgi:hypothetical protein